MRKVIVRRVRTRRAGTPIAQNLQNGLKLVNNDSLSKFNPSMLDLGDINAPSQEITAIAAMFDLSGFTRFSNQVDAHLAIPKFLNDFLDWFFSRIKLGLTVEDYGDRKSLWTELPILVKFLGDGVMLLWNTQNMTEIQICKIVAALYDICCAYRHQFYPKISMAVDKPPKVLRCGVARGKVFSIGNGKDYVGHCINTASRLSKLSPLSFCFHNRGVQVQDYMPKEYYGVFIKKHLPVRGLEEDEPVWIVKDEFDRLPKKSKVLFHNPDESVPEAENFNPSSGLRLHKVRV
jgi:class 3 adenylate cyclase